MLPLSLLSLPFFFLSSCFGDSTLVRCSIHAWGLFPATGTRHSRHTDTHTRTARRGGSVKVWRGLVVTVRRLGCGEKNTPLGPLWRERSESHEDTQTDSSDAVQLKQKYDELIQLPESTHLPPTHVINTCISRIPVKKIITVKLFWFLVYYLMRDLQSRFPTTSVIMWTKIYSNVFDDAQF